MAKKTDLAEGNLAPEEMRLLLQKATTWDWPTDVAPATALGCRFSILTIEGLDRGQYNVRG